MVFWLTNFDDFSGVDSTVSIILQWKDGRIANLGVSLLVGALPADAMIYADNGTVKVFFSVSFGGNMYCKGLLLLFCP